jgi:hypothetical protein
MKPPVCLLAMLVHEIETSMSELKCDPLRLLSSENRELIHEPRIDPLLCHECVGCANTALRWSGLDSGVPKPYFVCEPKFPVNFARHAQLSSRPGSLLLLICTVSTGVSFRESPAQCPVALLCWLVMVGRDHLSVQFGLDHGLLRFRYQKFSSMIIGGWFLATVKTSHGRHTKLQGVG